MAVEQQPVYAAPIEYQAPVAAPSMIEQPVYGAPAVTYAAPAPVTYAAPVAPTIQQPMLPSVGSMIAMPQQYQFSAQPQPAATAPAAPAAPAAPTTAPAAPTAPTPQKKKRAVETKKKR